MLEKRRDYIRAEVSQAGTKFRSLLVGLAFGKTDFLHRRLEVVAALEDVDFELRVVKGNGRGQIGADSYGILFGAHGKLRARIFCVGEKRFKLGIVKPVVVEKTLFVDERAAELDEEFFEPFGDGNGGKTGLQKRYEVVDK